MIPSRSEAEYRARINRVLDHISAHLDEELSLAVLAEIACFSHFHFHRLFRILLDETPADCVKRLRLERAAGKLRHDPRSITEIGLECGFSSSAAFARAFKERFGVTASAWRALPAAQLSKNRQAGGKMGKESRTRRAYASSRATGNRDGAFPETATREINSRRMTMNVTIKDQPGYHVAYMRRIGAYGPEIGNLWEKFCRWAGPRRLLGPETIMLGISHDDPHITPPEKCRYDACITVGADFKPEGEVGVADIPAGRYAMTHYEGPVEGITAAWDEICKWLTSSGYQPDDRPCYELYSPECSNEKMIFDICMPVKPL
jgi:AraC family transcriptional regulator